jgi:hypothetical protein
MCAALALGLAETYVRSEYAFDEDLKLRRELAGEIDYICLGASHIQQAVIPSQLDESLGVNSYILADGWQNVYISKILFERELSRNPVKEVVLDVTCDTFNNSESNGGLERDLYVLPRFENDRERLSYIVDTFKPRKYKEIFITYTQRGAEYLMEKALGLNVKNVVYENKGFKDMDCKDMTYKKEEAARQHNSGQVDNNWEQEKLDCLSEIIQMCQDRNIKVTVVVTPVTQRKLWRLDGWDTFLSKLQDFCDQNHCMLLDFNLLKSRFELFPEDTAFSNQDHLCTSGAKTFTTVFCQMMQDIREGKDVSDQFFDSYKEVRENCIYAK